MAVTLSKLHEPDLTSIKRRVYRSLEAPLPREGLHLFERAKKMEAFTRGL
jgi:hypothetical protein